MNVQNVPPLPTGTSKRVRLSLVAIQFLQYHNKLDGWVAFAGVWWGLWTLVYPSFWYDWPVTKQLNMMTAGMPHLISWGLLLSGLLSYFAKRWKWRRTKMLCSLIGFVCWCLLTTAFGLVKPIFSPAVACYSLFAIAKLLSYVNHVIAIDEHALPACPPVPDPVRRDD